MKLRVGLVGLGDTWERRHCPALRALADRFEVRAVCEPVSRKAELAAAEFGAAEVDGFHALVRREEIDAILILSPGWYGTLPVLAACESGKAVYFAAGLDLEPQEARTLKARVEEAGIAFTAEFARRQAPATLRLKELIATALGPPRLLFCHQRVSLAERGNRSSGPCNQRALVRELVELVDWCCYVVGKGPRYVTGVTCQGSEDACREDYRMLSLDFAEGQMPGTGPIAQISCGSYFPSRWQEAISYRPLAAMQVSCRRGIAFLDLPTSLVWFDEAGRHQESLESERPVGEQLLMQFYRAVTSLVSSPSDLEDACHALWIVEQSAKSYREGRRIEL
jgi:predicted dehydrogenase